MTLKTMITDIILERDNIIHQHKLGYTDLAEDQRQDLILNVLKMLVETSTPTISDRLAALLTVLNCNLDNKDCS